MAKVLLIQAYNLVWLLLAPLVLGYFLLRSLKAPAYRFHLHERFGLVKAPLSQQGGIVVHAVSMGEVIAATPIIEGLLSQYPGLPITVTCMSPTGREKIQTSFSHRVCCHYLPLDLPYVTARWLDTLKPQTVIIMETELWPNLLKACQQRLIATAVINARLSKKSAAGYRKFEPVRALIEGRVDLMLCQNRASQKRAEALHLARRSCTVGNLKFDYQVPERSQRLANTLKEQLGQQPLWVTGSTHADEELQIIKAYCQVRERHPELKLAIAPRHPERFHDVAKLLDEAALAYGRRSENATLSEHDIILIDTMGELLSWYQVATAAFIGGSLIKRGGHNPLEAMMFGCPVLSGPHVFNFKDIFHQLDTEQAVLWCDSDSQLAGQLSLLLDQPELRQRLSKTGKALFEQQAGATQRTLTQLGNLLGTRANHYKVRKQAGVEICWDSEAIKTPSGLAFEQSHWQNTNQIIGSSSGRNTAWFIQHQDKKMVLRHYYRGGLIGKLIKRSFFYAPSSKCRSFKEFRLLQRMVAEGLPVPNPIAALYRRTWLGYQASILIELLPETQDLCHHLMAQPLSDEQWQVVGKAIAKMHNKQVFHSDLNCHNILLNKQSKVFLIDFDKCDYRAGDSWKADNLSRLLRSLNKEKGIHRPFYFSDSNWQQLLIGYQSTTN